MQQFDNVHPHAVAHGMWNIRLVAKALQLAYNASAALLKSCNASLMSWATAIPLCQCLYLPSMYALSLELNKRKVLFNGSPVQSYWSLFLQRGYLQSPVRGFADNLQCVGVAVCDDSANALLTHSRPVTNCCCLQISVSDTGSMTSQLSVSTYYGLVKLLSTCVTGSHTVAENLLQSGISGTLHNLLRR